MVGRSFFALTQAFFGISPALVYLVAGLQLDHGSAAISAGTLVAFTTLQTRLLMPINQLLQVSVDVQSSLALFGRVFELLDLEPGLRDAPGAATLDPATVRGAVALEGVSFRYGGNERDGEPVAQDGRPARARPWALHDVSLRVEPGQLAALVGPSGAGKTTISYLVPRLYDVTRAPSGSTATTCARSPRPRSPSVCGVVTQESYLFGGTVRENLRYGRPDATDEEVEAAARAAFIHDRVLAAGRRLRHRGRRARLPLLRRGAPAAGHRARDPQGPARPHPRRGDVGARHRERADRPARRSSRSCAANDDRDRPPPVDDPGRRRDLRARGRPGRRARQPRELLAHGGLYARLYDEQFGGGEVEAHCRDGVVLASGRVARPSSAERAGLRVVAGGRTAARRWPGGLGRSSPTGALGLIRQGEDRPRVRDALELAHPEVVEAEAAVPEPGTVR